MFSHQQTAKAEITIPWSDYGYVGNASEIALVWNTRLD